MRVLVYNHDDTPAFDLPINDIFELIRTETLNGEHNIKITTTHVLTKGQRLLTKDATGKWYEWVVMGADEEHSTGKRPVGTYYCPWSIQHDLMGVMCYKQPGTSGTLVNATRALEDALSETNRWEVGTVDVSKTSSGSMWRMSAWEALSVLTTNWGGEIDAEITVSGTGVVRRQVSLKTAIGQTTAKRRFDWSHDVESITRKVGDDPNVCRIVPLGAAQETENGGYGRKITIESVNGGKDYLENANVKNYYRLPDGNGGWEYPTKVVENQEIDDPAKLKAWAQSILVSNTTPVVTYEANVLQLAQAGMDTKGLGLGDVVQVVDKGFYDEGLRLEGRVIKQEINELSGEISVEIGNLAPTLAQTIRTLAKTSSNALSLATVLNGGSTSTADVMTRWLERLNADINATGGFTYITEGQGIRCYDRAVTDPLVGREATKVVEIKGGTIRIANTKTSAGEWEWKTVFVSGVVAADLITGARLATGTITSQTGSFSFNLDTGEMSIDQLTALVGEIDDINLLIRAWGEGVLVAKVGQSVGALVNGNGSYDVVQLTWSGNTPRIGATVATFGANGAQIGKSNSNHITIDANGLGIYSGGNYTNVNGVDVVGTASTASTALSNAATAQSTANQASTAAGNAQTAANNAATAASNAQSTADGAQTTANNAATAAATADGKAVNAQTTANNAATAASNAQSTADGAQTTANNAATAAATADGKAVAAQNTANANIKSSVQLWFTKGDTTAPDKPTSKVTSTSTAGNAWRIVVPAYNDSYPYYYYCWQYQMGDGTYSWSNVVYDRATTEAEQQGRKGVADAAAATTAASNAATAAAEAATVAQTADGKASATQQYFWADSGGVHVSTTASTAAGSFNSLFSSSGLLFRKQSNNLLSLTGTALNFYDGSGNEAANVVSSFASGSIQIGKAANPHIEVDSNGMYVYNGQTLRSYIGNQGIQLGNLENPFVFSNSTSWGFYPANSAVPTTAANALTGNASAVITADGMRIGKYSTKHLFTDGNVLSFSNANKNDNEAHSINSTFMVDGTTPSLTFGNRVSTSTIGAYSVGFGNSVIASGLRSFAGGNTTTASGQYSFAWGDSAQAAANYAVAFGKGLANGQYSMAIGDLARTTENAAHGVALGQGTLVTRAYEFGFGKYNEAAKGYAYINPTTGQTETVYSIFSVGNGYDADNRHNALTLYDNGLLQVQSLSLEGILGIADGGTGSALFGTIVSGDRQTVSVPNDTWTEVASIPLTKGKWLVTTSFYVNPNANGIRIMSLDVNSGVGGTAGRTKRANATSSGQFVDQLFSILEVSSNRIYYANLAQTSGVALDAYAYITAIQLQ